MDESAVLAVREGGASVSTEGLGSPWTVRWWKTPGRKLWVYSEGLVSSFKGYHPLKWGYSWIFQLFSVNYDISPLIYGLSMGYFAWIVPFYHVFSIRIWLGKRLRDLLKPRLLTNWKSCFERSPCTWDQSIGMAKVQLDGRVNKYQINIDNPSVATGISSF